MVGRHAVQGYGRTVVVVGGGLSGASFAVQLSRASRQRLRIVIIEPRPEVGKGLAYSTLDPDHRLQRPFGPEHLHHPGIVANPLLPGALDAIPVAARVLVVGTGLTALDVLSTFVQRGHRGRILAVSRRGQRPRPQPPAMLGNVPPPPRDGAPTPLEQVLAPTPGFIEALGDAYRVADLCHALFRDAVWRIWARLPVPERRKFVRKLRPWYDVHRFRSPPRNDQMVAQAQQQGLITFARARLEHVSSAVHEPGVRVRLVADEQRREHVFDAVVNCSGLDSSRYDEDNLFLRSAMHGGMLVPDPTGQGFQVDADCRAVDAQGRANAGIRVIGPPTLGAHGDSQGVRYIAVQIYRMLPDVLSFLKTYGAATA